MGREPLSVKRTDIFSTAMWLFLSE